MNKQEFLDQLQNALSGLPRQEIEEQLVYYSEMIDDKMEEGISEEDAVAQIGPIEEIAAQVKPDMPLKDVIKEKIGKNYSLPLWAIICLIIGIPIWGSLLIGVVSTVFSMIVVTIAAIICIWAVSVAAGCCVIGGMVAAVMQLIAGHTAATVCLFGGSLVCIGLTILLTMVSKAITNGTIRCVKRIITEIKKLIAKRRGA